MVRNPLSISVSNPSCPPSFIKARLSILNLKNGVLGGRRATNNFADKEFTALAPKA